MKLRSHVHFALCRSPGGYHGNVGCFSFFFFYLFWLTLTFYYPSLCIIKYIHINVKNRGDGDGGRSKCEIGGISTKKETPERALWWFDVSLLYNSNMSVPLWFFFFYTKGFSHRFVYKMQNTTRKGSRTRSKGYIKHVLIASIRVLHKLTTYELAWNN